MHTNGVLIRDLVFFVKSSIRGARVMYVNKNIWQIGSIENLLEEIEEEGHITKRDFDSKCDHFYEICYNYIYNWSESNNHNSGLKDLLWVTLTSKIIVTWSNAKNSIRFLTTICNTICVEENNFFEQFKMFEKYFKEQSEEWHNISLKEYVKFSFSLPGSNAAVERVFSLMNSTWTKSRNKLDVSTVEATLMIKISFDNMSCCQFYESILANKTLLQKVHSSAKYQTTQDFSADGEHIGHRLKVLYFIISDTFAIQLDKSTDLTNNAQLIVFVRYQYNLKINEDLFFRETLSETTKGKDIFKKVNDFFLINELDWSRCVGFCADGAAALTGRITGFKAEFQVITDHLSSMVKFLSEYFPNLNKNNEHDWAKRPFSISLAAREQLIEIREDSTLEAEFNEKELTEFWLRRQQEYSVISKVALLILIPFA
ncbi:hypothetical protein QTP88_004636 [Uroleucon formosanum]